MGEKGNMSTFGYRREISKYEDIDEDELLASLTPEELKELERELDSIEPDQNLPVGQRQKSLTEKSPTGNFSREALMAYWEKETRNLMEKERLGECEEKRLNDENSKEGSEEEDFTECTCNTSDEDHTEEDESEDEEEEQESDDEEENTQMNKKHIISGGVEATDKVSTQNEIIKCNGLPENEVIANGLSSIPAKDFRKTQDALTLKAANCSSSGENPTVLEDALENIAVNDPMTSEVNLNNIDNITTEMLERFSNALKENTVVKTFNMANTHADDNAANAIANMLQVNRSITSLNIESNFITGKGILAIMRALKYNNVLTELRFHNQRHIMGSQVEMEIAKLLKDNTTVVKLGYHFELPGPRMSMTGILTRNMDKQRQKRMQEQRELGNGSANLRARVLQKGTPGSSPYASPMGSPWSSPKLAKKIQLTNNLSSVQLPPIPPPPPPPPPPPAIASPIVFSVKTAPTRNIAKVIKQHEKDKKKFQNGSQKRKGKKSKKKPDNILEEIKKSLRSISEKTAEETSRPSTPYRSVHDDLMAAIRDSSLKQLKPVGVPKTFQ